MAAPTAVGSIAARSDTILSPLTFDASGYFSDIDAGNSLTYSATGFPSGTGLSINATTGVISGTPTSADLAASFNVTVTATDEQNRTRQATVSFIASAVPAAAQSYYVSDTLGNDTNPGTEGSPWKTITRSLVVDDHPDGNVDVLVAPGNYRNQPLIPQNGGADDTHRIRWRVWGTGVVNILGPSSGQIIYGAQFNVPYVSVLRESSSSYYLVDGEVVIGNGVGQVAKNGNPEPVARIVRGITVSAVGVELDMNMTRLAGYDGIDIQSGADLVEININYEQHGIAHFYNSATDDYEDYGDMVRVQQNVPVGS